MEEKPSFYFDPPTPEGEFAEAVKKRYAYKHLSDFGYKVMVELGCPEMREEMVSLNHIRITVPPEYVDAVKKLAHEYTQGGMITDVVGKDTPQAG